MDQVLIKSDRKTDVRPMAPEYEQELKRRADELKKYKGEE